MTYIRCMRRRQFLRVRFCTLKVVLYPPEYTVNKFEIQPRLTFMTPPTWEQTGAKSGFPGQGRGLGRSLPLV